MTSIKNISKRPISVPLPQGKRLFLGPGKTGQLAPRAAEHPPLIALVEAGELEIIGGADGPAGKKRRAGPSGAGGSNHMPQKGIFRSGDG